MWLDLKASRNLQIGPKDGANVDGSCILALPTDEPFEGGALHVWDGKPKQVTCFFGVLGVEDGEVLMVLFLRAGYQDPCVVKMIFC